ncbi:MAG: asparagine synthase (glutamine-hydrolyzing) [Flavobacterium sp. JAD_PAG50586_2]|nr:MAG: asparagine synthase (glutamine-hydrolyzing) [Flavobacterium sp. JAD_PAG50586_2]
MCGIVGVFGQKDLELVQNMLNSIMHRGPDDSAIFSGEIYTVGAARLHFTDIKAKQPFTRNKSTIVYNGEIYNYKNLKQKIESTHNIKFETDSDTEVILIGYELYGVDFFKELDGMYSFAICMSNKLILSRDRCGIKPLYYTILNNEVIYFASEVKALFKNQNIENKIRLGALVESHIFGFVIGNNTFFENIYQLDPGSTLDITLNSEHKITILKSTIENNFTEHKKVNFGDAILELKHLLQESVKSKLIGNYEIGSLLSGGLDSSILTVLLHNTTEYNIKTFSISDQFNKDIEYSRNLSSHIKSNHQEIIINPNDVLRQIAPCIMHNEMPTKLNINFLASKTISQQVKGVISGDGADELFGGYSLFDDPIGVLNKYQANYFNLKRLNFLDEQHFQTSRDRLSKLYHISQETSAIECVFDFFSKDQLFNWQFHITDRSSMCNGLEVRLPFISNAILEFANKLSFNMKIEKGTKPLLRALFKNILSNSIGDDISSRPKMAAPASSYLCNNFITEFARDNISNAYKENHPLRNLFKSSISFLSFDLFVYIFTIHRGQIPEDFTIQNFYSSYNIKEVNNEIFAN